MPRVLDEIVKARGTIVDDGTLRAGRRALSHTGNKLLKTRKTAAQRKETLTQRPVHPDLKFVIDAIVTSDSGFVNFAEALEAVNEAQYDAELQNVVDEMVDEAEGA